MNRSLTAIIHIGTEKTGTSTLQRTLYENETSLLSGGVAYLHDHGGINYRSFAAACLNDGQTDDYFKNNDIRTIQEQKAFQERHRSELTERLASLPPHVHTVVISSEHFHSRFRQVAAVQRLYDCLASYVTEYRIICYLRRQVDLIASFYTTTVRAGQTERFSDLMERMLRPEVHYCNYEKMLGVWQEVFGTSSVTPRLFDRAKLHNRNVVNDFLHVAGIGMDGINKIHTDTNSSMTAFGQSLMRELNSLVLKNNFDRRVTQRVNEVKAHINSQFQGHGRQLDPERAAQLQRRFDGSNEVVRKTWFPDEAQLFSTDFSVPECHAGTDAQEHTISEVCSLIASNGQTLNQIYEYDRYADVLRDAAKFLEESNPEKAVSLLQLANAIRPHGPQIRRLLHELQEYRAR